MNQKLLPCPYCGEYPLVDNTEKETLVWCQTRDCTMYGGGYLFDQWNARHYPPEVQAVLDAAKRLKTAAAATLPDETYFLQYCRDLIAAVTKFEEMEKE